MVAEPTRRTRPSTTSSRRGRRTRARSASAAAPPPAAPTTCCRCCSRRPSASTPRTSTTCRTTAAATCCRRSSATRSTFATSGVGEFKDQIAKPATSGCWPPAATSGSVEGIDAPTLQGGRASTWSSPTGAASWPLPASATRRQERLVDAFQKMHDTPGVEGRARGQQLDRRLPDRRRVRDLPHRAGQAGRRHPERAGPGMSCRARRARTARGAAPSWGSPSCSGWSAAVVLVDALRAWTPRPPTSDRVGPAGLPDRRRRCCCSSAPSASPSTCCAAATARPRGARTSTSTGATDWRTVGLLLGGLRRQRRCSSTRSAG